MDNSILQYMRIYNHLHTLHEKHVDIPVTVDHLANLLCCTPRNVKFVLRKLEDKGWIEWKAGRGRGNTSRLCFNQKAFEILTIKIDELLQNGRVSEALDVISHIEVNESLKEELWSRFHLHLGLKNEQQSSGSDVLQIIRAQHLENLDPAFAYTVFELYILGQLFDTLVDYDTATEKFSPKLAHRWESNDDQTRWIFYLRKGVRFHDGRLLTSRDVKATFERLRRKKSPALTLFVDIEEVHTPDDYTVVFDLARTNAFFLHIVGCLYLAILPTEEKEGLPIGSGPFRLTELQPRKLSLSAFDGYFGYRPLIDRVDVWFLPGIQQESRTYQLSEEEDLEQSRQLNQAGMGCRYLIFNFKTPGPHHHPRFREAIRLLYDRTQIIEDLGGNLLSPANGFLPERSQRSFIQQGSLAEAAKLLALSGYAGQTLKIVLMDRKQERSEVEWLCQRAKKIGLVLEASPHDVSLGRTEADPGELSWATEMLEDDWELELLNFFLNKGSYLNRKLNEEQLTLLHSLFDGFMGKEKEGRAEVFEQAQALLERENWLLYGTHLNHRGYFNRNLYGLRMDALGFPNLSRLWVKTKGIVEKD
ncbi:ABC transporter substrate-binding protein [Saccharibacillus sp. JS10]|uniref:ABC transporter substrate-binding protein n=1 Tax=Saccharibacillus sp. JS10 TaxID=2950552 RepID=UPI00210B7A1F|nr:ABC transporter substrate-binding protein [Saccharibacillus sp. JS10]MCQ4085548.1 ABC transporter substrate-binding protein [Saccharibacillus sp. JS10]